MIKSGENYSITIDFIVRVERPRDEVAPLIIFAKISAAKGGVGARYSFRNSVIYIRSRNNFTLAKYSRIVFLIRLRLIGDGSALYPMAVIPRWSA